MGKDHKKKGNAPSSELTSAVVSLFKSAPDKALNYKQVAYALGIENASKKHRLQNLLYLLTTDEVLLETAPGRYKYNGRSIELEGIFIRKSDGRNWVLPTDEGNKIFIAERNSMHALDGDKVKVSLFAKRFGREPEGEVTAILKKGKDTFVGTLQVGQGFAFLVTDTKTLAHDIFIPKEALKEGKTGDKAVVRIVSWPDHQKNPVGEIIDILGKKGDNNTEMHAILAEYGLPYRYPVEVEMAADKISDAIPAEEYAKREDCRKITTFTIDPKDAKDFDDALSLQKLKNGHWEVGVHIADVSFYVREGDIIDQEAQKRATSVYLVDRTIPMLPERLSNGLCSLRPNEDKLCFSVLFELNDKAEVLNYRIARTVICSDRRFTYEEAQERIETQQGDFASEILTLHHLAEQLRSKRFATGAINFDRYEVKFEIDDKGKPLGVYFKVSKEANKLIEEFMLLANRTVAQHIGQVPKGKKPKTFIYRIHDLPDPEKLQNLSQFISRFGYKFKSTGEKQDVSKSINKLLDTIQGKPEENLIETITIRSMAKAVYSTENIGHYGLAFDYYTHFTSPIRRYPDTMVHRVLEKYMNGEKSVSQPYYEDLCKHSSDMELVASNAERASIKYKQVEFMQDKLGQEFEGVVSGVAEWGLYVELNDNKCEGLIPMRDLNDDYYIYDDKNYRLIGRRSRNVYQLGDSVKVKILRADLEKKQLDFELVSASSFVAPVKEQQRRKKKR